MNESLVSKKALGNRDLSSDNANHIKSVSYTECEKRVGGSVLEKNICPSGGLELNCLMVLLVYTHLSCLTREEELKPPTG